MPLFAPPDIEKLRQARDREGLLRALSYRRDAAVQSAAALALLDMDRAQMVLDAALKMGKEQAVAPLLMLLEHSSSEYIRRKAAEALLACYKKGWLSAKAKTSILQVKRGMVSSVHQDFTGPQAAHTDKMVPVAHSDTRDCWTSEHRDSPASRRHRDRRHTDTRPHVDLAPPSAEQIEAEKNRGSCQKALLWLLIGALVIAGLAGLPRLLALLKPSGRPAQNATAVLPEPATTRAVPDPTSTSTATSAPTPTATSTPPPTLTPTQTTTPTPASNASTQRTTKPTMTQSATATLVPSPTPTATSIAEGAALAEQTVVEADSPVLAVALSSDGRLLALGCEDGSVQLWDTTSGQRQHLLQDHSGRVLSIALSPDGSTLASAGQDALVRLWDTTSGQLLHAIKAHSLWVNSVAFSPDGRVLASASADRSVRLWDVSSGQEQRLLGGHTYWVASVRFAPDGERIASASCHDKESEDAWQCARGEIRLWDAVSAKTLQTLAGHDGWVRTIAIAPDGQTLASGSDDKRVRLWDLDTGQEIATLRALRGWVNGLAYSPDGRFLASVDDDSTLALWDAATGKQLVSKRRHSDYANDVAFSRDGRLLVTGSTDGTAILWAVNAD